MCTPPFPLGGTEPPTKFSKREGLTGSKFLEGGLLGKRGWPFSGGCNLYIKNKLRSEIFNDKKVYKQKCLFSVLNWQILTKNLVTFKK